MIDTGGTCVFLSDPNDYVCATAWPDPVNNPPWTQGSTACETIAGAIGLVIGDANANFAYSVDPSLLPPAARGLSLVMCQKNEFMRGLSGLNTGGLTVLFNLLAVDYANGKIGWKPK